MLLLWLVVTGCYGLGLVLRAPFNSSRRSWISQGLRYSRSGLGLRTCISHIAHSSTPPKTTETIRRSYFSERRHSANPSERSYATRGETPLSSGTVCQGSDEPEGDRASGKRRGSGGVLLYRDGVSLPGLPSQSGDRKRRSGQAGRVSFAVPSGESPFSQQTKSVTYSPTSRR